MMQTIAYGAAALCAAIIAVEFLWLYILSARSEATLNRVRETDALVRAALDYILSSPTDASMKDGIDALKRYVGQDKLRMNTMSEQLVDLVAHPRVEDIERFQRTVYGILQAVRPEAFYARMLESKDIYDRAYACRRMADFYVKDKIGPIRGMLRSKDRNLFYNAAVALSELGDEDGVCQAVAGIRDNYRLSHRIIVEIIDRYDGDVVSLGSRLLEDPDSYIRASVVKALAHRRIEAFEDRYQAFLKESDTNLRIAALKALGAIGKSGYTPALIAASRDPDWRIRSTAIRSMRNLRCPEVLDAVADATGDREWWVRFNAADLLTGMENNMKHVVKVINGMDRFASEAVLNALSHKGNRRTA